MARLRASRPACTRRGPDEKPSGPAPQGGRVASAHGGTLEVRDGTRRGHGRSSAAVARAGHGRRVLGRDERERRRELGRRFEPDCSDESEESDDSADGVGPRHLGPGCDEAHPLHDHFHADVESVTHVDTRRAGGTATVVRTLATGIDVPWGLARLPDGTVLVSARDSYASTGSTWRQHASPGSARCPGSSPTSPSRARPACSASPCRRPSRATARLRLLLDGVRQPHRRDAVGRDATRGAPARHAPA